MNLIGRAIAVVVAVVIFVCMGLCSIAGAAIGWCRRVDAKVNNLFEWVIK